MDDGGQTADGVTKVLDFEEEMALQRLNSIFPQYCESTTVYDAFCSFDFDFVKTVDFLINLSNNDSSSRPVLSFASRPDELPSAGIINNHPLSSILSSSASHGSGRRPFRCPYCGHTCPSGDFRFCPHCGHPLEGRPRL